MNFKIYKNGDIATNKYFSGSMRLIVFLIMLFVYNCKPTAYGEGGVLLGGGESWFMDVAQFNSVIQHAALQL